MQNEDEEGASIPITITKLKTASQ